MGVDALNFDGTPYSLKYVVLSFIASFYHSLHTLACIAQFTHTRLYSTVYTHSLEEKAKQNALEKPKAGVSKSIECIIKGFVFLWICVS